MLSLNSSAFSFPSPDYLQNKIAIKNYSILDELTSISAITNHDHPDIKLKSLNQIKTILQNEAPEMNPEVINKVLQTLTCATQYNIDNNNILTVIDYSLPSNQKRLWIFDLKEKKLLFHTYVSHGIKSGALLTTNFSNKYNSKCSSIGVYRTEKPYYGRDGISLKLDGLDRGFNDNASNRSVVMHGGWYVEEDFIKKYGRAGRSWGCPAIPLDLAKPIINTIKDKSLFVVYYPSDSWFFKSRYLNCNRDSDIKNPIIAGPELQPSSETNEPRETIFFARFNKNNEAVMVMPADYYAQFFNKKVPLERMLRRQTNKIEYIALSHDEVLNLTSASDKPDRLDHIYFVVPEIKMIRGYYETQMKIVSLGKITDIKTNNVASSNNTQKTQYMVYFDNCKTINLNPTNAFIRWVGL